MKLDKLVNAAKQVRLDLNSGTISGWFPPAEWLATYNTNTFSNDLVAAITVTIMLIPQALAYALLAGLPPEVGLYASILPLVAYALFGTSRVMAVGPVAVVSLLTASAVGTIADQGTAEYLTAAILLAFISGLFLLAMGIFRLGFLANFLSHPVITGFINAAAIIIATSQLKHLLGIKVAGRGFYQLVTSILGQITQTNLISLILGIGVIVFLYWSRKSLKPFLISKGANSILASVLAKAGPLIAVSVTVIVSAVFDFAGYGVHIIGEVPVGLPGFSIPSFDMELWSALAGPAMLISIIGFVESISIAQTLAAKKRQRIKPNQELIGLGMANLGSAFSGAYPVTGGFSRSVVKKTGMVERLFARYVEWCQANLEGLQELGFDFLVLYDDMAFKSGMMFAPEVYREVFLPGYRDLADAIKIPWGYHSDGDLNPVLDDLLSLGMNMLNPIEPPCMDINEVKRVHGHRVAQ